MKLELPQKTELGGAKKNIHGSRWSPLMSLRRKIFPLIPLPPVDALSFQTHSGNRLWNRSSSLFQPSDRENYQNKKIRVNAKPNRPRPCIKPPMFSSWKQVETSNTQCSASGISQQSCASSHLMRAVRSKQQTRPPMPRPSRFSRTSPDCLNKVGERDLNG